MSIRNIWGRNSRKCRFIFYRHHHCSINQVWFRSLRGSENVSCTNVARVPLTKQKHCMSLCVCMCACKTHRTVKTKYQAHLLFELFALCTAYHHFFRASYRASRLHLISLIALTYTIFYANKMTENSETMEIM